jgi:cyclopropane fatty-acyl-phospholipid synthase-like methyltransferase
MDQLAAYKAIYNRNNPDTADNFIYHFHNQFAGMDLSGKRILEIGCGKGFLSMLMASLGQAAQVTALDEAEGEGGSSGDLDVLSGGLKELGLTNVKIVKQDIMQYAEYGSFDVIVSNNAMHHVCEHGLLTWDVRARGKYVAIFQHIRKLLRPGGILLMHEYSRLSLWRFVPIRKYRDIEWSLHPTRGEWVRVLRDAGFHSPGARYCAPFKLRAIGPLVKNPVAMFLYYPNFILRATNESGE